MNVIFEFSVAAAGVVITSEPKPLLGKDECTWGPSYWCQNLQ